MTVTKIWILILLIPLIPVVLLYLLFEKQNYFELQDAAKGLVAMGPIAAYLVIVGLAYRIYFKISPSFEGYDARLDLICGTWDFVSTSKSDHVRQGFCSITKNKRQLVISGNFKEGAKMVGTWQGELMGLDGNTFLMVYSLQQTGKENLYGLVQAAIADGNDKEISGIWSVVGRSDLEGSIIYTRRIA